MKIKIIGFKVGQARPTANRTFNENPLVYRSKEAYWERLGEILVEVLAKSDFISIRRVDD